MFDRLRGPVGCFGESFQIACGGTCAPDDTPGAAGSDGGRFGGGTDAGGVFYGAVGGPIPRLNKVADIRCQTSDNWGKVIGHRSAPPSTP